MKKNTPVQQNVASKQKFNSVNVNLGRPISAASRGAQNQSGYYGRMVVLGRGRGNKLPTAPQPLNLPSRKSENSGFDPSTPIVPPGGSGWGKEKQEYELDYASQQTNGIQIKGHEAQVTVDEIQQNLSISSPWTRTAPNESEKLENPSKVSLKKDSTTGVPFGTGDRDFPTLGTKIELPVLNDTGNDDSAIQHQVMRSQDAKHIYGPGPNLRPGIPVQSEPIRAEEREYRVSRRDEHSRINSFEHPKRPESFRREEEKFSREFESGYSERGVYRGNVHESGYSVSGYSRAIQQPNRPAFDEYSRNQNASFIRDEDYSRAGYPNSIRYDRPRNTSSSKVPGLTIKTRSSEEEASDSSVWADASLDEQMDYSQPLIFADNSEEQAILKTKGQEREIVSTVVEREVQRKEHTLKSEQWEPVSLSNSSKSGQVLTSQVESDEKDQLDQRMSAQAKAAQRRLEEERRIEEQKNKARAKKEELERRMAERVQGATLQPKEFKEGTPFKIETIKIKQREDKISDEKQQQEIKSQEITKQEEISYEIKQEDSIHTGDKLQSDKSEILPPVSNEKPALPSHDNRHPLEHSIEEQSLAHTEKMKRGPPRKPIQKYVVRSRKEPVYVAKSIAPVSNKEGSKPQDIVEVPPKYMSEESKKDDLQAAQLEVDAKILTPIKVNAKEANLKLKRQDRDSTITESVIKKTDRGADKPQRFKGKDLREKEHVPNTVKLDRQNHLKEDKTKERKKAAKETTILGESTSAQIQESEKEQEFRDGEERREKPQKKVKAKFMKPTLRYVVKEPAQEKHLETEEPNVVRESKSTVKEEDFIKERSEEGLEREQIPVQEQRVVAEYHQQGDDRRYKSMKQESRKTKVFGLVAFKEKRPPRLLYVPKTHSVNKGVEEKTKESNSESPKEESRSRESTPSVPLMQAKESVIPPPIASGVVLIEVQSGIEQSDVGDFIEIKSRRKERREQKIKEKEGQKRLEKDKGAKHGTKQRSNSEKLAGGNKETKDKKIQMKNKEMKDSKELATIHTPPLLVEPKNSKVESPKIEPAWTVAPSAPRVSLTQIQMEETLKLRSTGKKDTNKQEHFDSGNQESLNKNLKREKESSTVVQDDRENSKKEFETKKVSRNGDNVNRNSDVLGRNHKSSSPKATTQPVTIPDKPFEGIQRVTKPEKEDPSIPQMKVVWEARPSINSTTKEVSADKNRRKPETAAIKTSGSDQNGTAFSMQPQRVQPPSNFPPEVIGNGPHPIRWQQPQIEPFFATIPGNSPFLPPSMQSPLLVYPFPQLGQLGMPFSNPSFGIAPPKQTSPTNGRRSDNLKNASFPNSPSIPMKSFQPEEVTRNAWSTPSPSEPPSISLAEYQQSQLLKQSKQSHHQIGAHPKPIQRPTFTAPVPSSMNNSISPSQSPSTAPTESKLENVAQKANDVEAKANTKVREKVNNWVPSKRENNDTRTQKTKDFSKDKKQPRGERPSSSKKLVYIPKQSNIKA